MGKQLIKVGEFIELGGENAEISRLLGQVKLVAHESDLNKIRLSTSEITQLDGTTLNQIINDTILRFDGAIIDFTTGTIFEADGTTPLGTNFTPFTLPASEYLWYGISLDLGTLNALGEQEGTVTVNPASSSNVSAVAAVFPSITGVIKRGWVQIFNNFGSLEVVDIRRLGVGSGSGGGGSTGTAGSSARDAYENRLDFSLFQSVSATVFEEDLATFIDTGVLTTITYASDSFPIPGFLGGTVTPQGGTWVDHPNNILAGAANMITIAADGKLQAISGGGYHARFFVDTVFPSNEYTVQAVVGLRGTGSFANSGVVARQDPVGNNSYEARYNPLTSRWELNLFNSSVTTLGFYVGEDPRISDRTVTLTITDALKTLSVDGVVRISSSDNTLTNIGFAGVIMRVPPASLGATLDDFLATAQGLAPGAISPPDNNAFKFSAVGQQMTDLNNATSSNFLAAEVDLAKTELFVRWVDGSIDSNATYSVSRDGGNEYQPVAMTQIGTGSNAFRGFLTFAEEALDQVLGGEATPNANRELTDSGAGQERAVQISFTKPTVIKTIDIDLNKIEAVVGNLDGGTYSIKVVRDASGLPSTDPNDLISETPQLNISAIAAGDSTVTIDVSDTITAPIDLIWVVIPTDAGYKAAFVTGVDALSIRVNSLTPVLNGAIYNGTTWSLVGEAWGFAINGREHDLKVRVLSGTANVLLESYGIYYHEAGGVTADTGDFDLDVFEFNGTDNQTVFNLVNISDPIPGLVEAWDEEQGNALLNGSSTYQIVGNSLIFSANYFNRPGISLTLKVRQLKAGIFDNSDANAAKLTNAAFVNQSNVFIPAQEIQGQLIAGDSVPIDLIGITGAVITGGDGTSAHIAIDSTSIQTKTNPTTVGDMKVNPNGGLVEVGDPLVGLNTTRVRVTNNIQTSYSSSALEAKSISGDVHIGLHASGATAATIQHVRGSNGIVIRDSGNVLADVSGKVVIASAGFSQPGGEILTGIRGQISSTGTINLGAGFSATRISVGQYTIVFSPSFSLKPVVVITPATSAPRYGTSLFIGGSTWRVDIRNSVGTSVDSVFDFIALGIR